MTLMDSIGLYRGIRYRRREFLADSEARCAELMRQAPDYAAIAAETLLLLDDRTGISVTKRKKVFACMDILNQELGIADVLAGFEGHAKGKRDGQ